MAENAVTKTPNVFVHEFFKRNSPLPIPDLNAAFMPPADT
jgi:hypothetical protein